MALRTLLLSSHHGSEVYRFNTHFLLNISLSFWISFIKTIT